MKTLAFDASTKYLTVAVFDGAKCVSEYHEDMGIRHSEVLVPVFKELLEGLKWKIKDIDLVAAGLGPGSFTGIRIALSTAKALCSVLGAKLIGVPTMDAIIYNLTGKYKGQAAVALDARKGKIYSRIYNIDDKGPRPISGHLLLTVEEFSSSAREDTLSIGDAVNVYHGTLKRDTRISQDLYDDWFPRGRNIGMIASQMAENGTDDPKTLEPLYLHAKECNINRGK
ncbi:MAG: tRNA (adenosine(37)-N6)-threonylcarbamoyltransferase complex dimerization subunit type 1 TsaB [Candidatus Omnitrophica bacterium]|nr:tRNA (adenosine(37)-N6)-threonylcarbamoyltransferase complex dimerization subunit type 1 TsaB [Candidatus Omnitrophota bacterium]